MNVHRSLCKVPFILLSDVNESCIFMIAVQKILKCYENPSSGNRVVRGVQVGGRQRDLAMLILDFHIRECA